tara:strand:- start:578 stop:769 length:192 start_codon:yes stop_codon:yes gene_type:complete
MITPEKAKQELEELRRFTTSAGGKMEMALEVSPEDFDTYIDVQKSMKNIKHVEIILRACNNFI